MGKFCHMATSKNSRKCKKKSIKSILNIELVLTHMILELGMFGIAGKLLISSNYFIKKFKKIE